MSRSWSTDDPGTAGRVRSMVPAVVAIALAVVAGLVAAVRAMPNMGAPDRGVFVSVAERMVAGDRLYVEVWDNKDPVFYYLMAAGRLVTPLTDYALELAWLAVVAVAAYALARGTVTTRPPAVVAAAAALLAVTGTAYIAGYTYLPGTALVLVSAAVAAARRPVWLGFALGVLAFTKPMMLPLALVAVAPWLLRTRSARDLARTLLTGAAVSLAFVAILVLRGELGGWWAAQLDNVGYSQQRLRDTGQHPVVDHLSRVIGARELIALALVAVVLLAVGWWTRGRSEATARMAAVLVISTAVTAGAAVVVIAATGLGPWHNQLLQPPIVLACALLAVPAAALLRRPAAALACLVLVPVTAWVAGGAASAAEYRDAVRFYRGSIGVLVQTPADAQAILALGSTGSYARLGGEYDDGHARGLGAWTLACPRFHQYFFQAASTLDPVLDCVADAPVVLVAPTFEVKPDSMQTPEWNEFVRRGEAMLAADYDCVAHEGFRLCTRRA